MIVLDANILIRAILGQRVGQLLDQYSQEGIRFYAPETAHAEAEEYLPSLLVKKGKPVTDLPAALLYLKSRVELVERDSYGLFESEAKARLAGRDDDDWPVLATALALACPIWTEDQGLLWYGSLGVDDQSSGDFPEGTRRAVRGHQIMASPGHSHCFDVIWRLSMGPAIIHIYHGFNPSRDRKKQLSN